MRKKVWLFCIFIMGMLCTSCVPQSKTSQPVSKIPPEQDTLEMEPDFSYEVPSQQPHIRVDRTGYHNRDKKVAFFYGNNLEETFEVRDKDTDATIYTGTLSKVRDEKDGTLYYGVFSRLEESGNYYIHQKQIGDSYSFSINSTIYNSEYRQLESILLNAEYTKVSDLAFFLSNYMFVDEMFPKTWTNMSYIHSKMELLLASQDEATGAFYEDNQDEVSLPATIQMAGVFAQYAWLYRESEDPALVNACLLAAQKAYRYAEKYRDQIETDAWYFASTQLYRLTRQYKYGNAITEYDANAITFSYVNATTKSDGNATIKSDVNATTKSDGMKEKEHKNSEYGYTMLADFTYLSTPYGTNYERCEQLLDRYLDKAQDISVRSSREHFYVLPDIDDMSEQEILEDMMLLGVVNLVLSGQEYMGAQKNYIHYLSGVNADNRDYLAEYKKESDNRDNLIRLFVVYANLYDTTINEN